MAGEIQKWSSGWWFRCAFAGLAGGVAMSLYLAATSAWNGQGAWYPLNVIAATFAQYRPPVGAYSAPASLAGLFLHGLNSAVWGAIYGLLLMTFTPRQADSFRKSAVIGLGWGVVFYLFMAQIIAPAFDPYVYSLHPGHFFIAHMIYGVVTAVSLVGFTGHQIPVTEIEGPVEAVPEEEEATISVERRF